MRGRRRDPEFATYCSYHYYCNSFVPSCAEKPALRKAVCDDALAPLVFTAVAQETARLGGAAMMTEGMACDYSKPASAAECQAVMAELDRHLFSWTDYGVSQGSLWEPSPAQQEGWARSYARAVAGRPLNMSFDPVTKAFDFCYEPDAASNAPTEIFASLDFSYTCGRLVRATQNLAVVREDGDIVHLRPAAHSRARVGGAAAGEVGSREVGCVSIRRAARICGAQRTAHVQ